jgi:hypothetical protein
MKNDVLEFTRDFAGDILGPIPAQDAVKRIIAFCCSPRSGFLGYDLVGHAARERGQLTEIGPWSILLADALAGRVTIDNIHGFITNIDEFATRISLVLDCDLAVMDPAHLSRVIDFCNFGFPGAWAPKITKVGALFRPRSIPILDGYLALAFGYSREAFSVGRQSRRRAIERVVKALAGRIAAQAPTLTAVRHEAERHVPAVKFLSDLRLRDIILWTSQDDRTERWGKKRDAWLHSEPGDPPSINDVIWLPSTPRPIWRGTPSS